MQSTPRSRSFAPVIALALAVAGVATTGWALMSAADAPSSGSVAIDSTIAPAAAATTIAPVTTVVAMVPATTASAPVVAAPSSTAAPVSSIAPATVPPAAQAPAAPVPVSAGLSPSVVLAVRDTGAVEAWTAAGLAGAVAPCAAPRSCTVAGAQPSGTGVVVLTFDFGSPTPRATVARWPLNTAAPDVLAEAAPGHWLSSLSAEADGTAVWWIDTRDGDASGTLRQWSAAAGTVDLERGVTGVVVSPDGTRLAVVRAGSTGSGAPVLAVRELASGAVRDLALATDRLAYGGVTWTRSGRAIVVPGADDALLVSVPDAGALRVGRSLPFVASCADDGDRVIGVVRHTAADGTMTHALAEADVLTGAITPWVDGDTTDGAIACRGDGAVLQASFPFDASTSELVARRSSGRRTLLGRGYVTLFAPLGAAGFSSMQCGGGDAESAPR